jgi:hypothetical protein
MTATMHRINQMLLRAGMFIGGLRVKSGVHGIDDYNGFFIQDPAPNTADR